MSDLDIQNPIKMIFPQHQSHQPGSEDKMFPHPRSNMEHYKAAGKLQEKIALISGGDSGIGRATAIGFAKEGADLAILYLDESEAGDARDTQRLIMQEGQKCLLIQGNVSDPAFCHEAVERTVQAFGKLDILVNNAAQQYVESDFEKMDMEQMEHTFRTNIFSQFYLTHAALPHLKEGAVIINTASITAYEGNKDLVDYSATKGAVVTFTRSLALNLAHRKIRVNAVAPGPIWTPLIPSSFSAVKVAAFGKNTTMQRPGQPDEVAPCYIFLASDDASYMTGQVLHPNGGQIVNA